MKIGVALSGCNIGGASAYSVLKKLKDSGFSIEMVSACCAPSAAAMLYCCGIDTPKAERLTKLFMEKAWEENMDSAISAISDQIPILVLAKNKNLAINCVHVEDGRIVTFTNAFSLEAEELTTLPLLDAYDALSSTASLLDGLGSYSYKNYKLCDFSCWYGCPLYPLKMNGISKIISIAFLPAVPDTPYEVLVRQSIGNSAKSADLHIAIEFPPERLDMNDYIQIATDKVKSSIDPFLEELYNTNLP